MFRWLDIFLPDRLKPVDDQILSDSYSLALLQEAERILDKLIEQGNKYNANRTIRKKHLEYKIMVKIKKKKISILIQDTPLSKSTIKKKIFLQCFRKYYKTHKGNRKWLESTIQYIKNGKTYVRNVRPSAYMQAILYKMDQLDDALLGQLIEKQPPNYTTMIPKDMEKEGELRLLYLETKRPFSHQKELSLDPLIENKLQRILSATEKLIPDFFMLEIEERYSVKRMLREDIPSLLHTYLSLSIEHQLQQKENIFISLSKMELSLIKLTEKLEGLRLHKMEHLLKVTEKRYETTNRRNL